MKTVVGLYDRFEDAQQVVRALSEAGFQRDNISMVSRDASGEYSRYFEGQQGTMKEDVSEGAATGAGVGAVLGGLGGLLVGLGALAIPGVGPVLAAGPLVSALAGAGIGAVAGGLVGALVDLGIPEEHANYYAEGVRRGGTLVLVQSDDQRAGEAEMIMNRFNPIDLQERAQNWQQSNWRGYDPNAEPLTAEEMEFNRMSMESRTDIPVTGDMTMDRDRDRDVTIPVVEEDIEIGKRQVDRGGVRVESHIEETPVEEDVTLRNERINVERRPVDRPASEADFETFEEGTMEFKETGEEPIVKKTARVVEEVHINKDVEEERRHIQDSVRRKDVNIEQIGDWKQYETRFRQHYQTNMGTAGRGYDYYQPAYRFGYDLRRDPQYREYDWETLEPEARRRWESQYKQSRWEDVKDRIRYAWEELTR